MSRIVGPCHCGGVLDALAVSSLALDEGDSEVHVITKMIAAAGLASLGVLAAPTASAESLEPGNARGMCLDLSYGDAQIARCDGSRDQDFRIPDRNGGRIKGRDGCLTSNGQGQALTLERCERDQDEQTWYLNQGQLENETGLCADVVRGGTSEGTTVQGYWCNGRSNQNWKSVSSRGGGGYGGNNNSRDDAVMLNPGNAPNKCLDLSSRSGNTFIINDCHGRDNQRFQFSRTKNTEILIDGQCVTNPGRPDRAYYVSSCNGSANQIYRYNSNGSFQSQLDDACMDVSSGDTRNGTAVIPYRCAGTPSQSWRPRR